MENTELSKWGIHLYTIKSRWIRNKRILYGILGIFFITFSLISIPPISIIINPKNDIKDFGWIYMFGFIFFSIMAFGAAKYTVPIRIYSKGIALRGSLFGMMIGHYYFIPFNSIENIFLGQTNNDPFIYIYGKKFIMPIDRREFDDLNQFIEIIKRNIGEIFKWGRPIISKDIIRNWSNIKYWENEKHE